MAGRGAAKAFGPVFLAVVLGGFAAGGLQRAEARACHYAPLQPRTDSVRSDDYGFQLGEGNATEKPTRWTGPIAISHLGALQCTIDKSVAPIEKPIFYSGKTLFVTVPVVGAHGNHGPASPRSAPAPERMPTSDPVPGGGAAMDPTSEKATGQSTSPPAGEGHKRVFVVDMANCQILWKSDVFQGPVHIRQNMLELGTEKKYRLTERCQPR